MLRGRRIRSQTDDDAIFYAASPPVHSINRSACAVYLDAGDAAATAAVLPGLIPFSSSSSCLTEMRRGAACVGTGEALRVSDVRQRAGGPGARARLRLAVTWHRGQTFSNTHPEPRRCNGRRRRSTSQPLSQLRQSKQWMSASAGGNDRQQTFLEAMRARQQDSKLQEQVDLRSIFTLRDKADQISSKLMNYSAL
jgi:hypothetical protein